MSLKEASAHFTCGNKRETYFGSAKGEILLSPADGKRVRYLLPKEDAGKSVTALAFDKTESALLVGTSSGTLYTMNRHGEFYSVARFSHPITALEIDAEGHDWIALRGEGILVTNKNGKKLKSFSVGVIPADIKKLAAGKTGIWAIADSDNASFGPMHLDMHGVQIVNPPQEVLNDLIDFSVSDDGSLWLGSNLRGIYHYKEKP